MENNHKNIISIFNQKADLYQERFMDVSHYASSFDVLINQLPENAHVLDVACGPANISAYLIDQRVDLNITGTDLAENMLSLARLNVTKGDFFIKDCRDFSWVKQKFDVIILGFCFPYISKEEAIQMIKDASKNLIQNGLLYISTMEDNYENSCYKAPSTGDVPPIFMRYHESEYLTQALEENGFNVVYQERFSIPNEKIIKDLVLISKLESKV